MGTSSAVAMRWREASEGEESVVLHLAEEAGRQVRADPERLQAVTEFFALLADALADDGHPSGKGEERSRRSSVTAQSSRVISFTCQV